MKRTMILLAVIIQLNVSAQDTLNLDLKTKKDIIDTISSVIRGKYIYADTGEKMADFITARYRDGAYDSVTEVKDLCIRLTDDLRTIINDKHLWIYYDQEEAREILADKNMLPQEEILKVKEGYLEWYRNQNYGFRKVEIMNGNIGYLKIDYFANMNGAETCIGAMAFLANTRAIIIDLRDNGGGESIGSMLSSYFFTADKVLLGSVNYRDPSLNETNWTLPYIPGRRMPDVILYILTSARTFSAAEAFAYDLQQLKRAVIVGETTKGGAHPINVFIIKGNILAQVPVGSSYNPISKTNWEGCGVKPDIGSTSDKALGVAYMMALDSMIKMEKDETKVLKLDWVKKGAAHIIDPFPFDIKTSGQYVGQYGNRAIMARNDNLYFLAGNQSEYKMIALGNDLFMIESIDYIRLQFEKNSKGKVIRLAVLYDDGTKQIYDRK
jgi:hypothetical protein